jgi:hypothetical protein
MMIPVRAHRVRLLVLAATLVVLAACSDCGSKCQGGITFYVGDVAGALAHGGDEPLQICVDGQCRTTTITRANAGGTVFLAFKGVGKSGDHAITVKGTGSMQGSYKGPLDSYTTGASCGGSCALASVKIGADGSVIPGRIAPTTTTSPAASTTTPSTSG